MKASSGEIGTLNYFPRAFVCFCENRFNRPAFLCLLLIAGMAVRLLSLLSMPFSCSALGEVGLK